MAKLQPGQMLGSYRIIEQIGEGGMAAVYKAYQPSMDRNVAVKVLPGQLAENEEFVKRFQREARIIAKLEHPYILPVFDYGEDDGVAYFVMRYLEAGTLKDRMRQRSLNLQEIDRIFTQLTDALGYAHAQGVVHRDLKPANALIDSSGNLFLTDFGIAKLLESASPRLTQTDAILGTPAYISPEQAAALPVDQRSDIYSLGVILYEMVTGRVPFTADTPLAVIIKHLNDPLPLPSSIKPTISPATERVLLRALAKRPEDRFETVTEFASAWKRSLAESESMDSAATEMMEVTTPPTQEKPAPKPQALTKPQRTPLIGFMLGCVVFAFALVLLAGVSIFIARLLFPTPLTVHLDDDFSQTAAIWRTGTDTNGSIQYDADRLRFIISTNDWFAWSIPNSETYSNIHMEVTAVNNGTDSFTAFGLMCSLQADGRSYYYFAITPAGQYVIAKAAAGQTDTFLTNNGQWGESGIIPANAASYRLGADCVNGSLTLFLDGQAIASATDTTYTSGGVGLFVWSAAQATRTDISFDDFLLTDIP
jgi:serine/threonine protein kinase